MKDEHLERLRKAVEMAAGRFSDLADIIEQQGPYRDAGFCRATARRLRAALDGKDESLPITGKPIKQGVSNEKG